MRSVSLLACLAGLVCLSVADVVYIVRPAVCNNRMVRCFDQNAAVASHYCSELPVMTQTANQTVTVTATMMSSTSSESSSSSSSSVSSSSESSASSSSLSSSSSSTTSEAHCPTGGPWFPCANCQYPQVERLACSCIGVPQKTVTTNVTSTTTIYPSAATTVTTTITDPLPTADSSVPEPSVAAFLYPTTEVATSSSTPSPDPAPVSTNTNTNTNTETDTSYIGTILRHHNVHRANHSATAIGWSDSLAATALKIASTCVYGHDTATDGGGYGQNIGAGYSPTSMGAFVTTALYNGEFSLYNYYGGEPDMADFHGWGHLTQIVWASTTAVGCATYDCSSAAGGLKNTGGGGFLPYFTVCNYSPPGNYGGQYTAQVKAPLGHDTVGPNYGCPGAETCG